MKKCFHNYLIIGTGFVPEFIETDIVCKKCGKSGTIYIYDDLKKQIVQIASKHKVLRISPKYTLTKKQYKKFIKKTI